MYQAIGKSEATALEETISIELTVKEGFAGAVTGLWSALPSHLVACVGTERQDLFDCYSTIYDGNLDISNILPTAWLVKQGESMVDFYMHKAMREMTKFCHRAGYKRLLMTTTIPCAYEHFADLGFSIVPRSKEWDHSIAEEAKGYKRFGK